MFDTQIRIFGTAILTVSFSSCLALAQTVSPDPESASPDSWHSDSVTYVAGLGDLKQHTSGSLRITADNLVFSTHDAHEQISLKQITSVSIGDERVATGGAAGKVGRKIPLYGIGLPLLVPRIGPLMIAKKGGNKLSALINIMRVERQVQSCFFDLTAATSPAYLASLKETHDPSKLLMGFDFPFMPPGAIGKAKDGVSEFEGFSDKEKSAIDQDNAEKLFPRLTKAIAQALSSTANR